MSQCGKPLLQCTHSSACSFLPSNIPPTLESVNTTIDSLVAVGSHWLTVLYPDRAANTLKEHLMEELDYSLMPEAAWSKLHLWYGLSEGSSPIARSVCVSVCLSL